MDHHVWDSPDSVHHWWLDRFHIRVTCIPDDMLVVQVLDQQQVLGVVMVTADDGAPVITIRPADSPTLVMVLP